MADELKLGALAPPKGLRGKYVNVFHPLSKDPAGLRAKVLQVDSGERASLRVEWGKYYTPWKEPKTSFICKWPPRMVDEISKYDYPTEHDVISGDDSDEKHETDSSSSDEDNVDDGSGQMSLARREKELRKRILKRAKKKKAFNKPFIILAPPYTEDAFLAETPPNEDNLTFRQVVGAPCQLFAKGEELLVRDAITSTWDLGQVEQAVESYYYITMIDETKPAQWIRKNSNRLRKIPELLAVYSNMKDAKGKIKTRKALIQAQTNTRLERIEKTKKIHKVIWQSFELDQYIRVKHPFTERFELAKITMKAGQSISWEWIGFDPEENKGSVHTPALGLSDDAILTAAQKARMQKLMKTVEGDAQLSDTLVNPEIIKDFLDPEKRWKFHRRHCHRINLKALYPKDGGLVLNEMSDENGHSLYRALSHQIFGTEENYLFIRRKCIDYISENAHYFGRFVDIDFERYVVMKRAGTDPDKDILSFGDHLDIQAFCELYDVRVIIYSELDACKRPIHFYESAVGHSGNMLPKVILSYAGNDHYDSLKTMAQMKLQQEDGERARRNEQKRRKKKRRRRNAADDELSDEELDRPLDFENQSWIIRNLRLKACGEKSQSISFDDDDENANDVNDQDDAFCRYAGRVYFRAGKSFYNDFGQVLQSIGILRSDLELKDYDPAVLKTSRAFISPGTHARYPKVTIYYPYFPNPRETPVSSDILRPAGSFKGDGGYMMGIEGTMSNVDRILSVITELALDQDLNCTTVLANVARG